MGNNSSTQHPNESGNDKLRFIEIREAMNIYGGSEAWWRKAVWQKRITTYRRGGRVVFKREDVEAYFESRRVPAKAAA